MWGAIIGDIAGSMYEWNRIKTKDFEFFGRECEYTDDSVCTTAAAEILLDGLPAAPTLQRWCRRHPGRGYGGMFAQWIDRTEPAPYGSFGNGAAMRVSPAAFLNRSRPVELALRAPEGRRPRNCRDTRSSRGDERSTGDHACHLAWLSRRRSSADPPDGRARVWLRPLAHRGPDPAGLLLRRDLSG